MNPSDILNKILTYSELNPKSFSEHIGLDRPQAIYDILNGKTKSISQSMASKIVSVFPDIQKSWLLTGEGDMIEEKSNEIDITGGVAYAELLNKLIKDKLYAPFALLEQRDEEIKELNREIGRLEERLEVSKKTDVLEDTATCADAR